MYGSLAHLSVPAHRIASQTEQAGSPSRERGQVGTPKNPATMTGFAALQDEEAELAALDETRGETLSYEV